MLYMPKFKALFNIQIYKKLLYCQTQIKQVMPTRILINRFSHNRSITSMYPRLNNMLIPKLKFTSRIIDSLLHVSNKYIFTDIKNLTDNEMDRKIEPY